MNFVLALLLTADPKADSNRSVLVHTAPAQAKPNEALTVEGSLEASGLELKELVLLYRGPGQDYVEVKMSAQYGDLWRAAIPASRMVPPGVEYYVEGRTKKNGERVPLFKTATKPARVLVLEKTEKTEKTD